MWVGNVICVVLMAGSLAQGDDIETSSIVKQSNGQFSASLFEAIRGGEGNLLVSPLSLGWALTALSFGADGNSLEELRKTLHLPNNEEKVKLAYQKFTNELKNDNNMSVATKLFVDKKFPVKSEYNAALTQAFDAGSDNLDFQSKTEESRVAVNKFVDEKTNHLIPTLFDKGGITSDTVAVLVNAVYFKSFWKHPFDDELTQKKPFYGLDGNYETLMMSLRDTSLLYKEDKYLNAQLLQLPYVGDYVFFVILPKEQKGLKQVEQKLQEKLKQNTESSLTVNLFKGARKVTVDVQLPKFKFEQTHDLGETLQQMGIKDVFGDKANLRRISDAPIAVSKVVQKTYISVDEKSTEAAAATGIGVALTAFNPRIEFNADHSFVYGISHQPSQSVVFLGRFSKP